MTVNCSCHHLLSVSVQSHERWQHLVSTTFTHSISVTRYVTTSPTFNSLFYILFFSFPSPMFLISSQQHVTRLRIIQSESLLDRFPQAVVGGHHFHYINIGWNVVGASRGTCSQCVCGACWTAQNAKHCVGRKWKCYLQWEAYFYNDKQIYTYGVEWQTKNLGESPREKYFVTLLKYTQSLNGASEILGDADDVADNINIMTSRESIALAVPQNIRTFK